MDKLTNKDPIISVIIPLLNRGPYIGRAIESVLKQTIQNFEIIVVDGGSDDNGPEIVKKIMDPRIHFLVQSGKGVSNARNEAVYSAKSDFIAFLDADDEWMPNHLETICRLIKKFPGSGMYSTAYKIQHADGKIKWADYKDIPYSPWEGLLPNYFKSGALGGDPVWTSVVVIPKKVFHEMGGFPEGYGWGEDVDLFGKIALKYPVAFSWECGAIWHCDASNRINERIMTMDYVDEPFIETAHSALMKGDVSPEFIEPLNEYIANRKIYLAARYVRFGSPDVAQAILKQCDTKWHKNEKMKWLFISKIPYPIYLFLSDIKKRLLRIVEKKQKIAQ